jgi:nucleoside-diphosphate-sugar epimerase
VRRTLLVAGATGYTGQHVVLQAAAAGAHVVAHIRPDSPRGAESAERFAKAGAEVDRTPWDDMVARVAALHPTHIFALLGTTAAKAKAAARAGQDASYQRVDRDHTLALLAGAEQVDPRPVFVYLSSMGAEGTMRNAYLQARHDVERALAASDVPWIVARPAFLTGPDRAERRLSEQLGAAATDGLLGLLGAIGLKSVRDSYKSIDGERLARALLRAPEDPARLGTALGSGALQQLGS